MQTKTAGGTRAWSESKLSEIDSIRGRTAVAGREGRSWRIADNARDDSQRPEYIVSRAPERRKWAGQWTLELGAVSAPSRSSARAIQRAAILFPRWRRIPL